MMNSGGLPSPGPRSETGLPPFVFYQTFPDEWEGFSLREREVIVKFLEDLQERYDDPEFLRKVKVERNGKYFAARLPQIDFTVYWTIASEESPASATRSPRAKEIRVLAVERSRVPTDQIAST